MEVLLHRISRTGINFVAFQQTEIFNQNGVISTQRHVDNRTHDVSVPICMPHLGWFAIKAELETQYIQIIQ